MRSMSNAKLNPRAKSAAVAATALLGITVLAGCSSSSEEPAADETTSQQSEESTQLLPPVIIEPEQKEATAKVGDFIDIVVDDIVGTTVATSDPEILEVTQARQEGDAVLNPGAKALAAGDAVITVTLPDGSSYDTNITVTE